MTGGIYQIGDTGPAGGIVFYDKWSRSGGWRYLEAARGDQSASVEWGGHGEYLGTELTAIGSGRKNTEKIAAEIENLNCAARICCDLALGGYTDWFLPSRDELNELYKQMDTVGGFASRYYWSSSEYDSSRSWVQHFGGGIMREFSKCDDKRVRAVRYF